MLGQMQVLLFLLLVGMVGCIAHTSKLAHVKSLNRGKEVDNYLQTELSSCTIAQHTVLGFLKTRGVVLGSDSYSSGKVIKKLGNDEQRITVGTAERKVECRISLGPAPVGSKCVAPCGCTGSQKWVQFSELNRLRRKDPSQWSTCRTCQQKFEYNSFTKYGGLKANLIGYLLDNRAIIRSLLGLMFVYLVYTASLPLLLSRALTAQVTWQQVRLFSIPHHFDTSIVDAAAW